MHFAHTRGLSHGLHWNPLPRRDSSVYEHDQETHITHNDTMSVVSVTESKLAHVFQYLTLYFVSMYCLEMFGQGCALVMSLVCEHWELGGPCFLHMMFVLDVVFVLLLLLEINMTIMLTGWKSFVKKADQALLLILLIISVAFLFAQWEYEMSGLPAMFLDIMKQTLRAVRVAIFYKKLKVVLESPLSHWDVHDDILQEEDQHANGSHHGQP